MEDKEYWEARLRLEELLAKAETELLGLNWEDVK